VVSCRRLAPAPTGTASVQARRQRALGAFPVPPAAAQGLVERGGVAEAVGLGQQTTDPRLLISLLGVEQGLVLRDERLGRLDLGLERRFPDNGSDASSLANVELFAPLQPLDKWPKGETKDLLTAKIRKEGAQVRGINTAATLWASAAVGAFAGSGQLAEAALVTLFVLAGNTLLRPVVGYTTAARSVLRPPRPSIACTSSAVS
jgi:hypothetical protein